MSISVCTAFIALYMQSSNHNNAGEYHKAHTFGKAALGCNIAVFIYYGVSIVAGIILIAVYFTVGFNIANDYSSSITKCSDFEYCNYS